MFRFSHHINSKIHQNLCGTSCNSLKLCNYIHCQKYKVTHFVVCSIRVCNSDDIIYVGLHNTVDFQAAIDAFQRLEKLDPYRLSSIDTYSNVLFVKVITIIQ